MEQILFSCHNAHSLLTEPKLKSDKESGKLSETTKSMVEAMWLKDKFGYKEPVFSDEMMKGNLCEQDSMKLVQEVLGGEFRARFNKQLHDDYFKGTPDIVLQKQDYVEDIKTSFNLRTFFNAVLTPEYKTQGHPYMKFAGKSKYRLIYCLVPTPDELIVKQQTRLFYQFGQESDNPDYIEASMQVKKNNDLILSIPKEKRVKVFEFEYEPDLMTRLRSQADKARIYYNSLSL